MNDIILLRAAAPEAPPLRPAVRSAARAALIAEIQATSAGRVHRRPRANRRMTVRMALAATAVAATWATAVAVTGSTPGIPASSVTLVAFEPPSFPLALDPAPTGLTPHFSADPGGVLHAGYSAVSHDDRVSLKVTPEEPERPFDTSNERDVTVQGRDAEVFTENTVWGTNNGDEVHPQEALVVAWSDDQWVKITGDGAFAGRDELLAVADTLVERPQVVPLQVHLAPSGWSVYAYKEDRILTLANDRFEQQTLTVSLPAAPIPADQLLGELMGPVGPVIDVTVNVRPAQLVAIDTGWYLQAQFADGRTFVVQAPEAFTQEQVLAFAAEVTYTP